ncbi:MAG: hypothetical protein WEE50_11905 [Chloroflexota bacterium]
MLQLTLAYIQQADREREVATELQNQQMLRSTTGTMGPVEPHVSSTRALRRTPVRARAVGR